MRFCFALASFLIILLFMVASCLEPVSGPPAAARSEDFDDIILFLRKGPNLAYRAVVSNDEEGGKWVAHNCPNSEK